MKEKHPCIGDFTQSCSTVMLNSTNNSVTLGKVAHTEANAKHEKKPKTRKRGVRFCPKCGSPEIRWARGLPQLWSIWECRNCGYYGAFIVEDGKMSKKLQDEYAKRQLRAAGAKQETSS